MCKTKYDIVDGVDLKAWHLTFIHPKLDKQDFFVCPDCNVPFARWNEMHTKTGWL